MTGALRRARHGHRRALRQPRGRLLQRPRHRRRRAGAGAGHRRRAPLRHRRTARRSSATHAADRSTCMWRSSRCRRCAASRCEVGRRPHGRPGRPQRRRQDHAHARRDGPPAAARRAASSSTARTWPRCRATRAPRSASATCRRTAAWCPSSRWKRTSCVPVWVNKSLDDAERLALVYRVLPELQRDARRAARCCCRAASRSWWRWRARWRSARGCCCSTSPSRAWRRRCRKRPGRRDRRPEGQRGLGADLAERPQPFAPLVDAEVVDRARRQCAATAA